MNGRIVGKKPLYVGLAQPKEERKAMLMVGNLVFTIRGFFVLILRLILLHCLSSLYCYILYYILMRVCCFRCLVLIIPFVVSLSPLVRPTYQLQTPLYGIYNI